MTGRKAGGALSEIGFGRANLGDAAANDIDYTIRSANGRLIKSSTMPLRDGSGHVFGALCVNVDVTVLRQAEDLLNVVAGTSPAQVPATTFSDDFDDCGRHLIWNGWLAARPGPPRCTRIWRTVAGGRTGPRAAREADDESRSLRHSRRRRPERLDSRAR